MWHHLSMTSLGVIESADLELNAGFTVITGETGAGKTMVVTALGLLRGGRADPGLVRTGVEQARVEASVSVGEAPIVDAIENAGGVLDDGAVLLGRSVSTQGRSRAFAGGATVPASLLGTVTDELVAVHGQADQHRLARPSAQLEALDAFAGDGVAGLKAEYGPAFSRLRAAESRLADLTMNTQARAQELDLLRHGLAEIANVVPVSGEDVSLKAEEDRLAHAEALVRAATSAHTGIASDEGGSARDAVALAVGELREAAGHDPRLDQLAIRARDVSILLDDLASDLNAYTADVELDPARLATVQDRISALAALQRKYGPSVDDVLAWQEKASIRVTELDSDDESTAALEEEINHLKTLLSELSSQLSEARREAGRRLSALVEAELSQLSMPTSLLTVQVSPRDQLGPDGRDVVEFLFAANSGTEPRPLAKGASGGELSRLMLALEVVLAHRTTVPTLVFDEVDAGIGGKAAVEVGRRLARLAANAQVLAVTHLPQVAAFADHHFRVLKDDDGSVTRSSVTELGDAERVDELARMLAGQEDSASAQAHARELLELAAQL